MLSAEELPFSVVLEELLTELGVGATNEATREALATVCETIIDSLLAVWKVR